MEEISKRTTEDRISALPDCLLLHILSLLNTKEVVKTGILSKRWQYLWTSVPTLTFEYRDDSVEEIAGFVAWVTRTLLLCADITAIKKFVVDFNYYDRFASDVDVWLRFAAARNVGDLTLDLRGDFGSYTLPQSVCCNSSLKCLKINNCIIVPKGSLSWASLAMLTITQVELNDDTIAKILSGSPRLEFLNIHACWGISRLDINSKCLREMVIYSWYEEPLLEISAPNLQKLEIWGLFGRQFRLMNFSSLLIAKLDLQLYFDNDDEYGKQCSDFIELLESLHHVEELELEGPYILALLLLEAKGLSSPLSRLKCLKLNTKIEKHDVPGIISLLKCAPNLEKLFVNRTCDDDLEFLSTLNFPKQVQNYWRSERRLEKFSLAHLKIVKFSGFKKLENADEFTLKLVQVLLENAGLLGRVVISVGEYEMLVMPRAP